MTTPTINRTAQMDVDPNPVLRIIRRISMDAPAALTALQPIPARKNWRNGPEPTPPTGRRPVHRR